MVTRYSREFIKMIVEIFSYLDWDNCNNVYADVTFPLNVIYLSNYKYNFYIFIFQSVIIFFYIFL